VVSDPTVSRRHAEPRPQGGGWVLADLGSTNGTRLNGWRLTGEALVRPGDEVAFGSARFRLG
jgi:pSer/pThr/pTyr-binding forkhead associated (FHA) protein